MNLSRLHIAFLLLKEATGELSPEEVVELNTWKQASQATDQELQELTNIFQLRQKGRLYADAYERAEKLRFSTGTIKSPIIAHRVHFLRTSWFRYAAALIVLVAGAAAWYMLADKTGQAVIKSAKLAVDITPGTNRAELTVGNKTIDLATNKTGITVNNAITYNDGEKIVSTAPVIPAGNLLQLKTPKGGQYQAVLPDGSKVWLNAASSIKFPSTFSGDKREVEITGEVYLEIAKNSKQPFFVRTDKAMIQVLGTSFNVNAYEDEDAERTTLIEGSIKVKTGGEEVILKPSQQASIPFSLKSSSIQVHTTNTEEAIAWKNGQFQFEGADVNSVMRQLERWYDVEIEVKGNIPQHFVLEISRDKEVSEVFQLLKETGRLNYSIEGKKITITP